MITHPYYMTRRSLTAPGSTTVYPYNDTSLPEIELGASIFVKANKNLWRATDEFNLTRRTFKDDDYETGIWDGEKFLLTVSFAKLQSLTQQLKCPSSREVGGTPSRSSGGMALTRRGRQILRESFHSVC